MAKEKVLEVKDLEISFKTDNGLVQAVRKVSFDLHRGETLCIVGESGSGKSVTSKTIMGILANNAIIKGGSVMYKGEDLTKVSEEEFHRIRGNKIGMIFQDPLSSLNPIVKIGKQITEATLINADNLKKMYNEIIGDDLSCYYNLLTRKKALLEKEDEKYLVESRKLKDNLKACKDVEEKAKLKENLKKLAVTRKTNKKALEKEYSEKIKAAKIKLDGTKKDAKKQVAEYKTKITNEYKLEKEAIAKEFGNDQNLLKEKLLEAKVRFNSKLRISKKEAKEKALKIMEEVGIPMAEKRFKQYPFEFSGGMRQRIVIAIALTASPEILICDEPTTALDVTIQAQILELINKLKKERDLSCIFITHDLGVVANMAERVAVMYAGKIVEYGTVNEIFYEPKHPYTWALLSSIPDVDSEESLDAIPGTPPNMIYPPKGDAFALRSKYAMNIDFKEEPPYFKVSDTHYAATWLLHPDAPKVEMPKIVSERIKKATKGGANNAEK